MVSMNVRSMLNNNIKRTVLEELSHGEIGLDDISKRSRLPPSSIDRAVRAMMADDIIGGPDDMLYLTQKGKDILHEMQVMEREGAEKGAAVSERPAAERLTGQESRKRTEDRGT